MSTTVLSIYAMHALSRLNTYLQSQVRHSTVCFCCWLVELKLNFRKKNKKIFCFLPSKRSPLNTRQRTRLTFHVPFTKMEAQRLLQALLCGTSLLCLPCPIFLATRSTQHLRSAVKSLVQSYFVFQMNTWVRISNR